jgi:type II secretory pathway predicted ATPase ExeA
MKLQEIGFREHPFAPGHDPRFVYLSESRRHVLAAVISAIREGKRLLLITGARGIGKTTTLNSLANIIAGRADLALADGGRPFPCRGTSTIQDIDAVCQRGAEGPARSAGATRVVLLDDVDSLPPAVLAAAKARALAGSDGDGAAAVVMTAAGRGRLSARAEDRSLREGTDVLIKLQPLAVEEVPPYVHHRLRAAGYQGPELFGAEALERVAFYGNGSPQRITALCAEVLNAAASLPELPIPPELVKDVAWELFVPERLRRMAKSFAGSGPEPSVLRHAPEEGAGHDAFASFGEAAAVAEPEPVGRLSDLVTALSGPATAHGAADAGAVPGAGRRFAGEREPAAVAASANAARPERRRRWKSFALSLLLVASLLFGGATGFYLVRSQGLTWTGLADAGDRVVSLVSSWMSGLWNAVGERLSGPGENSPSEKREASAPGNPEAPAESGGKGDRPAAPPPAADRGSEPPRSVGGTGSLAAAVPVARPPREGRGGVTEAGSARPRGHAPIAADGAGTANRPPVDDGLPAAEADAVQLLARGNRMLELGDLASARLFFRVVAERGDANAAMLMGLTFDPVYFRQQGIRGAPPEADEAMDWYRRAIASGSKEAEQRSRVLVSWLHWRAETGDGEAARVLQRLR